MLLTKIFVELIGTFLFLSVILSQGSAIPIGVALAAVIFFGGNISGGHFNPAVTFMKALQKSVSSETAIGYVVAQLLGASLSLLFFNLNK